MARSATVGALRVTLGADTAQFEQGMKLAQSRLSSFSSAAAKAAAGVAAAMSGLGALVAAKVQGMLTDVDKLAKMSRSIGVPVEQFTALKYAAEQSGASVEELARLFRNVARNMQAAALSGGTAFSKALESIGVAWRDAEGNFRRADELLLDVADKFKTMQDGAGKTALAMKIFGEMMGPRFVSMLNSGSDGIRQMMEEARKLGITLDQQTADAAERFSTAMTKMNEGSRGMWVILTKRLAPALATLAERFAATAGQSKVVQLAIEALVIAFKSLVTAGTIVHGVFREIINVLSAAGSAIMAVARGELSQALEAAKSAWSDMGSAIAEDIQFIRDLWTDATKEIQSAAVTFEETVAPPIVRSTKEIEKAAREMEAEARRVFEATRTPAEQLRMELDKLNRLLEAGAIDWDTYQRAIKMAQDRFTEVNQLAAQAGAGLADAFTDAITGARRLSQALQNVLQRLARLALNQVFNTLIGLPINAIAGGVSGVFAGMFAEGGSFKVPGPGGIDSKLVAFRATPGERVTVSKKGDEGGGLAILQPRVVVNNYADASVDSRTREDGTLELTVRAIVRDELGSERVNPIMRNKHGLMPRLRAR
jgi:hypothetical protein